MVEIFYSNGKPVLNPNMANKYSPPNLSYHVDRRLKKFLDKSVIKRIQKNDKDYVMIMDGYEGCLSGDTLIQISRCKISRKYTLKRLYNHFNNNPDKIIQKNKTFDLSIPTSVRSFNGNDIRLHKIKNVTFSGKKEVYKLKLIDDKEIKATANHKFLTRNGWKKLKDLKVNEEIMCDDLNTNKSKRKMIKNSYSNFSQGVPNFIKIRSIKKLGEEDTYDIECEYPHHNFSANGIIVHNSGKSTFAQQLGTYVDPTLDLSRVCMTADEFKKAVMKADKAQCVIYDEAVTGLSAGESITRVGRLLKSLMMQMRQKNLFVIVILPSLFEFNKYAVLSRARSFFHVYERGDRMGFFVGYNRKDMRMLYLKGKKTHSYLIKSKFTGRFFGKYTVPDDDYRKKKEDALLDMEDTDGRTGESKFAYERKIFLANFYLTLKKYEKMTHPAFIAFLAKANVNFDRNHLNYVLAEAKKLGKVLITEG